MDHQEPGRTPLRRIPGALWALTAVWTSLLLGASLIWPVAYGYDEVTHVAMAYEYSVHPFRFYGPGQLPYPVGLVRMQSTQLPGFPPHQRLAVAPAPPRPDRPTLAALGGPQLEPAGGSPDQMVQHPPLYYWLEAAVMRVPGVASLPWDLEIWVMRLLSVVIMAPVPLLCWEGARRLLAARRGRRPVGQMAVFAAIVPLTIPNLVRDGSSVTNDSLLILSTSLFLAMMARVVTGDLSRRSAVWAAIGLAAALWTKGFALILPLIGALAYLGAWRASRPRRPIGEVVRPLAVVAAGGLIGSVWWVRNVVDYGTVQTDGYGAFHRVIYGPVRDTGRLGQFVGPFLDGMLSRVWAGIGLPDIPGPGPVVQWGWLAAVSVLVVAAFLPVGARRYRPGPPALLLTAPILTLAVVAAGAYSTFHKWPNAVRGDQGRYLYSSVVAVAAVASLGADRLVPDRVRKWFATTVFVLALATNAAAWVLVLRSWYQPVPSRSGLGGFADAVHGLLRWSPLPYGLTVLFVLVLPLVTSAVTLLAWLRPTGIPAHRAATGPRSSARAPAH